jgi:hypothetical protein
MALDARLAVQRSRGQFRVVAVAPIAAGELLLTVDGRLVDQPSRYSIQVGPRQHIAPPVPDHIEDDMDRHAWRFLNHSCAPSAVLRGRALVALRALRSGDEVTFDYATTEHEMAEPFVCGCGASTCRGLIRGFVGLSEAQRLALEPYLATHLREPAGVMVGMRPAQPPRL